MRIDGRDSHRLNQFGLVIHANMRFHPKVPLVGLLRLVHHSLPSWLVFCITSDLREKSECP
jgi:hypothetical protein